MNIAIITDSFPPMVDGVSRCVLGYAMAITESTNGKCIVVAPRLPLSRRNDYPFPVYYFNSLGIWYNDYRAGHPFLPMLISIMREMRIDLIHVHSPFLSMTIARQLRHFLKIPIIFTQHTKWDYDLARALPVKAVAQSVERFVYQNIEAADDVWAVSDSTGKYLTEHGFKGDYFVMPNGTDFPQGSVDKALLDDVITRHSLPEGVPVLLFVGRMMRYKGIFLIIEAMEMLRSRGFAFRMIFIGDGRDLPAARTMVKDKNLDDLISFTGRVNNREQLRAYYTRANLFLLPSTYDNAPLVVQEAAACSCPSLVVRGSSASEVLEDGVTGYFSEQSSLSIANAIQSIFSDMDKHSRVTAAALEHVYTPWSKVLELSMERYKVVKREYDIARKAKKVKRLRKMVLRSRKKKASRAQKKY